MVEDLELGVKINADTDQLEQDLENADISTQANIRGEGGGPAATGGDGRLSQSQQQQQEGIISGGVSKGLLAAGIFGALLSQLKSVTGIIEAVFGAISRFLVPIVEKLADQLRPFIESASEAAATPRETFEAFKNTSTEDFLRLITGVESDEDRITTEEAVSGTEEGVSQLVDLLFGSGSADQSGEATKTQAKELTEDAKNDVLGG